MTSEAGRELDAEIAEKVMGWERQPTSCMCGGDAAWLHKYRMVGCVCHTTPHYSADIAAAWQVVERMRQCDDPTYARFADALSDPDGCSWLRQSTAPEAAHRICLAALAGVGYDPAGC